MENELVFIATAGTGEQCPQCGRNIAGERYYNINRRRICVQCHDDMFGPGAFDPPPNIWKRIWNSLKRKKNPNPS